MELAPALSEASAAHAAVVEPLRDLEYGWADLAAATGAPTQSLAWARACAAAFGPGQEFRPIVVGSPESPLAIAPLVRARRGLRRLELAGVNELFEPTDLLYRDES